MHLNIRDSITITDKSLLTVTLYLIQTVDISSAHGYVFIRTLVLHDSTRTQTFCVTKVCSFAYSVAHSLCRHVTQL